MNKINNPKQKFSKKDSIKINIINIKKEIILKKANIIIFMKHIIKRKIIQMKIFMMKNIHMTKEQVNQRIPLQL